MQKYGQVDKMKAHGPAEKEMAREKKEERKAEAELDKKEARHQNAAEKLHNAGPAGPGHATGGTYHWSSPNLWGAYRGGLRK